MLGGAVSFAPETLTVMDHLPPWINRLIGLSGLFAIACYLIWLVPRPRIVGRANWRIVLPDLRRTLLQIGIGTADRCLASLSIFILLPASPSVGFVTVGVVEAAILIGLPQYPREELLATLLTFRVLDFFLPLLFATLMFSLREMRLVARCRQSRRADTAPNLVRQTSSR